MTPECEIRRCDRDAEWTVTRPEATNNYCDKHTGLSDQLPHPADVPDGWTLTITRIGADQ